MSDTGDVLKTSNNGGAREVVARAIAVDAGGPTALPTATAYGIADAALEALRPIIAAEIRAWADEEIGSVASIGPVGYIQGQLDCLEIVGSNSDAIASRICICEGS
jgi:hypothetical protein